MIFDNSANCICTLSNFYQKLCKRQGSGSGSAERIRLLYSFNAFDKILLNSKMDRLCCEYFYWDHLVTAMNFTHCEYGQRFNFISQICERMLK